MEQSRIKNPDLVRQVDDGLIEWHRTISPITDYYCQQITGRDYRGKRLAYWGHITGQNILLMMSALQKSGAEIVMGACNVDSTDDAVAAYAAAMDIQVFGWQGMSQADYEANLHSVRAFEADYLCDMGGEMIVSYLDKQPLPRAALEATTSGITLLEKRDLPFPVFDWNNIHLKNLHNRFHVGDTIWPAFNHVTSLSLYGRPVLVIGFGPVGKGIAERARNLGAVVHVADLDPVRLLEARHFGCQPVSLAEGLERCEIIVTATGAKGILRETQLRRVHPGTILFNAGHSNQEIDIEWLYRQPHRRLKAHIERFELGNTHLFLLGQGSLLNLAGGAGPFGVDQFDHYTAVMLLGISWMFDGIPPQIQPGLQPYPLHLEQEIARQSLRLHGRFE